MTFQSATPGLPDECKVRGWNGPLPFYMVHPYVRYNYQEEEVKASLRDLEYLQQMYPTDVKRYRKRISEMLDKMDYEGSMIYDEYPDCCSLRRMAQSILKVLQNEEENPPSEDMVMVLLFHEIYKRRRGSNRYRGFLL